MSLFRHKVSVYLKYANHIVTNKVEAFDLKWNKQIWIVPPYFHTTVVNINDSEAYEHLIHL